MSDTTRAPSNEKCFIHRLISLINKYILRLTITNCKQASGLIKIAFSPFVFLRCHNLPSDYSYILPEDLIEKGQLKFFNQDETELIRACELFNTVSHRLRESTTVSKVTIGDKLAISFQSEESCSIQRFIFDEKHFSGLMVKYASKQEIRKMIRDLFK